MLYYSYNAIKKMLYNMTANYDSRVLRKTFPFFLFFFFFLLLFFVLFIILLFLGEAGRGWVTLKSTVLITDILAQLDIYTTFTAKGQTYFVKISKFRKTCLLNESS